jgi:tRNA A-37 threonylcarbamoyl transferase component Bud32
MGQVYKARPTDSDRIVALKVIRSDRQEDLQLVRRFQREARAGRRLDHPNIVTFYDAQQVENVYYLTMEFVDGSDLARLQEQSDGPLAVTLACECARQAARGLQHAHERGLIHRDIKPSNLLLTKEGTVKILDMGLVRLGACPETGHADTDLTHSGVMMGTPAYMAPEQVFDARNVDGRADIYSLGCTLYELLAGRPPHRHQMKEPPPLHWARPEISPVLAAVVQRMMARMPEDRYAAAVDVVKALAPFCHGHADASRRKDEMRDGLHAAAAAASRPSRASRRLLWLALAGAVLVAVLGLFGLARARGAAPAMAPRAAPTPQQVRQAIDRSLAFLEKDAAKWRKERKCATCHHGTMTVWVLCEAKSRGYAVTAEAVADAAQWTSERLKDVEKPRDKRPGWSMVSTPAVYLAVMALAVPKQEAVSAADLKRIAGHLLRHREADGSWAWSLAPAQNRPPPVFESDEVVTLLAYLALGPHVPADPSDSSPARAGRERAAAWLRKHKTSGSTQATAIRLFRDVRAGQSPQEIEAGIARLLSLQKPDGGWGQDRDLPSDAYATGQALYFLSLAGVKPGRAEVQRAVALLVTSQRPDGSWPMTSRAHPGEKPMTNPVPITYFGSAWAALGLLRSVAR